MMEFELQTFDFVKINCKRLPKMNDLIGRVETIALKIHDLPDLPSPLVFLTLHVYGLPEFVVFMPQEVEKIDLADVRFEAFDCIRYNLIKIYARTGDVRSRDGELLAAA